MTPQRWRSSASPGTKDERIDRIRVGGSGRGGVSHERWWGAAAIMSATMAYAPLSMGFPGKQTHLSNEKPPAFTIGLMGRPGPW